MIRQFSNRSVFIKNQRKGVYLKILVLNQKIVISIFSVMLLIYGIQTPSYGADNPIEIDGRVHCQATYLRDNLFEVWVFGTIHAIRYVRSVTVTAYVDNVRIGEHALGNLFADDYVPFSIVGIHEIHVHEGGDIYCSLEISLDDPEADTDDSDDTGVPIGTTYDTGDTIPDSFVFGPTSSYTLDNREYVQVNDRAYICISPDGCSIQEGTVTQGTIEVIRIDWSGASAVSELAVFPVSVSKSTLSPGEDFTLSATVRNQGKVSADGTTLRYYRSTDTTISSSDTEVGTDSVSGLDANEMGDKSIRLTAPTSAGVYYYGACVDTVENEITPDNNCSTAVPITVERVPTELVKLSGDNQSGVIGEGLSSPFVVEVRDQDGAPFEGVTVMFAITAGDGVLSVTTATTDAAGLAETTLTLGSTPGTNTVLATVDGIPQTVTFNAMGEGIEFDLTVSAGTNLIHVPLRVSAIDGVAKTIESISDVYDALGGADKVNFLMTYDTSTQAWLSYFSTADRGSAVDRGLTDEMGILAGMKAEATVRLRGDALDTAGSSAISLTPGLNLVGLPLRDPQIARVSDLLALDGIRGNVSVIILYNGGETKLVGQAGDPGDVPITGGQGFMLTAQQAATVAISGEEWSNVSATAAAPQILTDIKGTDTTPVLALRGLIVDEATGVNRSGFRVAVKNLSTGRQVAATTSDDGAGYRLAVVDIETMQAARVGDVLEITARSTNPFIGVKPLRYTVTAEDVKRSLIQLPELIAYEIPAETELLANYPNPFNPETWIPYRLAEDAFVMLTIYDGAGRVVRSLDVGNQVAGIYESRSKAVYFDGRNEFGEQVASGVYFYHLSADSYSQTRKMLILK